MERIPEPELMENPSQVKAYADADFSRSDSMVVKGLEKYLKKVGRTLNKNDLIFDIACGPGNIAERIAKNWSSVKDRICCRCSYWKISCIVLFARC